VPYAELDGVSLYYEVSGPADGDPLVLIAGFGAQLLSWYPGFCELLEAEGFRVVLFDNRDVGLSQKFENDVGASTYTLVDMAGDVARLIDHLGYGSAHVVGQSMGGMIAQQLAISFPERVRSLCSLYAVPTFGFFVDDAEVQALRSRTPGDGRDDRIRHWIDEQRVSGLDGLDDDFVEELGAAIHDRCYYPEGKVRHLAALQSSPDRTSALAELRIPTVVIHGRNDRLLDFNGGIATALAVPGAELHLFADMGHQVKPELWSDFVRAIVRNADRAAGRHAS
jgi:pimeloyl-ACP methyl ester carboxylesterase